MTNMMNAQIAPFLEIMRRHRVNADYQLHISISEYDVEDMFDMFDAYLNECRRLPEVIV